MLARIHPNNENKSLNSSMAWFWPRMNFETVACMLCIGFLTCPWAHLCWCAYMRWPRKWTITFHLVFLCSELVLHCNLMSCEVKHLPTLELSSPLTSQKHSPKVLCLWHRLKAIIFPLIHFCLVLLIQKHRYTGQSHRINKADEERAAFPSASSITGKPGSWVLLPEFHFSTWQKSSLGACWWRHLKPYRH